MLSIQIIMTMISLKGKILLASRNKRNCRKIDSQITIMVETVVEVSRTMEEVADDDRYSYY